MSKQFLRKVLYFGYILCFGLLIPCLGTAQPIDRLVDFFTLQPNQRAARQDTSLYPAKLILTPLVAFSPETSLEFGVGAKYLFKFRGSGSETRTSNMPLSATYTLNNQVLLFSGFSIFSKKERYILTGNLWFRVFPQFFYGIGRDSPSSAEEEYSFTQVTIEPILLKQTWLRYLFVGGGVRYNYIGNMEFETESTLADSNILGVDGSTSVGIEAAVVYDSRDNILTAHRGWYVYLTHGFYESWLGSSSTFQLTRFDARRFIPLLDRRSVLALQLLATFSFGDVPLNELGALGGDQIMRGYYDGRFVDRHLLALQAEYRFKILGRLGAVVFAGAGDVVSQTRDFKLGNFRPTVGAGLRFLIDRREDLNIRFDYGIGRSTQNYYFQVGEAF